MDNASQINLVRRIEVKRQSSVGKSVSLTKNEWQRTKQLTESY
ncbi:hypothetical protein IQ217_02325 [Synechocystis salina LEGE 00031]|uniref:Uncharacterized protein n=2 Tax=Synechocystis TaxID=1142 RepID=A0ABR9VMY0_9SYNC|nr:hypothetical protein [Synechocystis salina LEGE 00041]MBE9252706.1 hypothetical protein [Synechocystis salina LEGE 00031]